MMGLLPFDTNIFLHKIVIAKEKEACQRTCQNEKVLWQIQLRS